MGASPASPASSAGVTHAKDLYTMTKEFNSHEFWRRLGHSFLSTGLQELFPPAIEVWNYVSFHSLGVLAKVFFTKVSRPGWKMVSDLGVESTATVVQPHAFGVLVQEVLDLKHWLESFLYMNCQGIRNKGYKESLWSSTLILLWSGSWELLTLLCHSWT